MHDELNGNVLFIFQPAEEGAPEGEEGGAELMLKQGLFSDVFLTTTRSCSGITFGGLTGRIGYQSPTRIDKFEIVKGKQTHFGLYVRLT